MTVNAQFWANKKILLTGHTGFKGGWLSIWLKTLGAEVMGLALDPPTSPNLFSEANVASGMTSVIGDIRDYEVVRKVFERFKPEIVIHMAAQPLVRASYQDPITTYATNVMGTVHILEAARNAGSVRAIVNVTTDKCYENKEWAWGYRENESMGGYDPYSNSKGCSELVTSAFRQSFFANSGVALASARAGNVIGGGDWAVDRLVPDILRAFEKNEPVVIRNPNSTRPWQHVLEPLSGYLTLAQSLYIKHQTYAEAWNFGPKEEDAKPVQWIVENLVQGWGRGVNWILDGSSHPHEAHYLKLDISKARARLDWTPRWSLDHSLKLITAWHQAWLSKENTMQLCQDQILEYTNAMKVPS